MVPAFTGLGAPYWDMYARGAMVGITRGTQVFVRKVAPLGDPMEVTVRGYELSLRKADTEMIEVE